MGLSNLICMTDGRMTMGNRYKWIWAVAIVPLLTMGRAAAEDSPLDAYKAKLEQQLTALAKASNTANENVQVSYLKALLALKNEVQKGGSLENTTLVVEEIARLEKNGGLPDKPSGLVPLAKVQVACDADVRKIKRAESARKGRLLEQYDTALERLQKDYVRDGKLDEAKAVKTERDRVALLVSRNVKTVAATPKAAPEKVAVAARNSAADATADVAKLVGKWDHTSSGSGKPTVVTFNEDGTASQKGKYEWNTWSGGWKRVENTIVCTTKNGDIRLILPLPIETDKMKVVMKWKSNGRPRESTSRLMTKRR
jgi:hypothetical protein